MRLHVARRSRRQSEWVRTLVCGSPAGPRPLHQEHARDKAGAEYGKDPEGIYVPEKTGLTAYSVIQVPVRLLRRGGRAGPMLDECVRSSVDGTPHNITVLIHVGNNDALVILGTAREEGGNERDAHASADVPRQIRNARNGITFLTRHTYICDGIDGDEEEREAAGLKNARPHCLRETNVKRQMAEPEETE
jgi:VCBS repeat-containing protein